MHHGWQAEGRRHAGIPLTRQIRDVGVKIGRLERAARLLTPEIAANQLMRLDLFWTEDQALAYVAGLRPLAP